MNQIRFYSHNGPFGAFSNFSDHPVTINGKYYPTTEHYFQSQKFINDSSFMETIRVASTPAIAKKLGSSRTHILRNDWENVKEDIMLTALRAKFTQHPNLKQLFLSTDDKILVEHTINDSYWADGGDGTGLNRLGHCLMIVRDELK
jgi:ribA/ribD-fused uncharacterized protein